ncbi:hypothetical protein O181_069750 [Austropuccinia psidii MF-1]|uniref:Uncharacterized protein n=1 Tax=Austropuccinia psidii MF-1 TaxID=1389203 RepID=A0A9Q3I8D6_9BASI|nr:hypothetical protein [Austropuccinia psidii MF-1]
MLANKHTRNAPLLSNPSDHVARGVPAQDALARTPLWSTMMKVFPSGNGPWDPKRANRNNYRQLALSLQASIFPPPHLGHHPMVTSLLDRSNMIIGPMKDGDGKRQFELGPIITMSCHPWYSNAKVFFFLLISFLFMQSYLLFSITHRTKTTKSPPTRLTRSMYALQANPAATHSWPEWHPIVGGLIHCPSSEPPEDVPTCEPQPEVAPTKSMEEPFAHPATPHLVIIINDMHVGSPPPISPSPTPPPSTPVPPPSHYHQEPNRLLPPSAKLLSFLR